MEKKILINIDNKGISANFVRERSDHIKIYILDEIEYFKFKSINFENPIVNLNCQVLEYEEKENELVYTLKNPAAYVLLPSNKIEVVAMNPYG